MTINEVVAFIRAERRRRRLTQTDMSVLTGLPRYFISDIEHKHFKRGPSFDTCERLLNALGYSLTITQID